MTARTFLVLLLAPACAADSGPSAGEHLPSDAYFTGILSPYQTLDACLARYADLRTCAFELALCGNGRAGERMASYVREGGYHLEGHHAVGVLADMAFDIDVETGYAEADNLGAETWIPDVAQLWRTPDLDVIHCR
jgi:hypothetical protein